MLDPETLKDPNNMARSTSHIRFLLINMVSIPNVLKWFCFEKPTNVLLIITKETHVLAAQKKII